jgi:predicted  nucleic acid-binding Zn-ribbon protein
MSEQAQTPGSNKLLYIVLAIAGTLIVALAILYFTNRSEMQAIVEEMNEEKVELTMEFQDLALDYDSLQTNNDTLSLMLEHDRERIAHLIEEIKTIKATNSAKIREYKKELTSLRKVLKNYVVQIDSLNRKNQELSQENVEYRRRYTNIKTSMEELEEEKETLEEKVEIASKLEISKIEAIGLNHKDREAKKASRVTKIRICFTILKNITAEVGEKMVYLRVQRPDNSLLVRSLDDKFEFEGSEINYSSKRIIEYGGENLDVCVYYVADPGELMAGQYEADLFIDGRNIGTHQFELK